MSEINRAGPTDAIIGRYIRARRREVGLSQVALGEAVGVSKQAIAKYESGGMRIAAARLCDVARALDCEPSALLAGIIADRRAPNASDHAGQWKLEDHRRR